MQITKDSLLNYGMKETGNEEQILFPMKKVISIPNQNLGEEDEGEMAICVTTMRNQTEICLLMPDGAILYLCPQNIEELYNFEKCIQYWEPNY
jgi:hypothetical protein